MFYCIHNNLDTGTIIKHLKKKIISEQKSKLENVAWYILDMDFVYRALNPDICTDRSDTNWIIRADPDDVMGVGIVLPQYVPTSGALRSSPFNTRM